MHECSVCGERFASVVQVWDHKEDKHGDVDAEPGW